MNRAVTLIFSIILNAYFLVMAYESFAAGEMQFALIESAAYVIMVFGTLILGAVVMRQGSIFTYYLIVGILQFICYLAGALFGYVRD